MPLLVRLTLAWAARSFLRFGRTPSVTSWINSAFFAEEGNSTSCFTRILRRLATLRVLRSNPGWRYSSSSSSIVANGKVARGVDKMGVGFGVANREWKAERMRSWLLGLRVPLCQEVREGRRRWWRGKVMEVLAGVNKVNRASQNKCRHRGQKRDRLTPH